MFIKNTNFSHQARSASRLAKPDDGHCGRYFNVRNMDSTNGLSLLTRGRLYEDCIPSSSSLALNVRAFIGAPLSECSTKGFLKHCSAKTQDRKSTRLNSSHVAISYAVFCLTE